MARVPEEHAVILMPGHDGPQVWPTRGRSLQEFEAFCATCGATVVRIYPTLEEAKKAASPSPPIAAPEEGGCLSMKLKIVADI